MHQARLAIVATNAQMDECQMNQCDMDTIEVATRAILVAIGEDPDRPELRQTPARVARFWKEFIDYDAGNTMTTFASTSVNQMVVVSDMRVWSLCEHHLMPFWCDIAVGYIARDVILGLSKFGRIAEAHAHRLNVQERLVESIANDVSRAAMTPDVAVIARGEHTCMTMRGIRKPALMTSSVMRGVFHDESSARAEFLRLAI